MARLILASTSPRRKALLEQLGLDFDIVAPDYEEHMDSHMSPSRLATHLSLGKAKAVSCLYPDSVVIGADTFISYGNEYFGKPKDYLDASAMLARLSGTTHEVVTGFSVVHEKSGTESSQAVRSAVTLRQLSDLEIDGYVSTGEPLDKAGAYALQGMGAALIERIDGDFSAIIGLPIAPLAVTLRRFGIPVLGL